MHGVLRKPWVRSFGWGFGLALLAGMIWWASGPLLEAFRTLRLGDLPAVAAAAGCVVLSLAATSLLFSRLLLLFPHEPPVPRFLMFRLVVWSGLLNSLPLPRAGLWGRAAYLKARHDLPLRASVWKLAIVVALAAAVLGVVAGSLLFTRLEADATRLLVAGAGVLGVSLCCAAMTRFWTRAGTVPVGHAKPARRARPWLWPLLRAADLAAAAGRLVLTLHVVGVAVSFPDALLLASGSLFVRMLGLTPNGIGLAEAATAALASAFTPVAAADAAAAALLDRAIELLVLLALVPLTGGWRGLRDAPPAPSA